jgi:cytoskeletal protein RodZ
MDKTIKKISIIFVGVSLAGILFLTIYNQMKTPSKEATQVLVTNDVLKDVDINPKTKEETKTDITEETPKEPEEETEDTEKKTDNTKNTDTSKTDNNNENNQTTDKQEETTENQPTEVVSNVSVQIIGVDGVMASGEVAWKTGNTAYEVMRKLTSQKGISISTNGWGAYIYVSAIGGLAERDYGGMSGWYYTVNGVKPDVGAGGYQVQANDKVVWYYEKD